MNGNEALATLASDGTAVVSGIKSGDTVVFKDIPEGCKWAIEETDYRIGSTTYSLTGAWSTAWTSSAEEGTPTHDGTASSGTLAKDTTVAYTNTNPAQCDLTISKEVLGPDGGATFSFDITLTDAMGSPVTGSYSYTKPDGTTGTLTFDANGKATVTGVADGKDFTILDLPYGTTYAVTEADPGSSWTTTNQRQRSVVLRTNTYTKQAAEGYNTWPLSLVSYLTPGEDSAGKTADITDLPTIPDGSLVVVKRTAMGATPNPATDSLAPDTTSAWFSVARNGTGGITLTAGDYYKLFASAAYAPLIGGRFYAYVDYNYLAVSGREASGTLTMDEGVTFTNTNEKHDLTIAKTTAGTGAQPDAAFNFIVGLTNVQGKPCTGTYSYATSTGATGTITLDAAGQATIPAIGNGATVTIKDLPGGATWSVDETSWVLGSGVRPRSLAHGPPRGRARPRRILPLTMARPHLGSSLLTRPSATPTPALPPPGSPCPRPLPVLHLQARPSRSSSH